MAVPVGTAVATLVIALLCLLLPLTTASQKSVHIDSTGKYRNIVVGFSKDFQTTSAILSTRKTIVESIKTKLNEASEILNQLIGVQFGEVTIVLPDDWNIPLSVNETEAQYKPLSEADLIFTENEEKSQQILTLQSGDCGEGGHPINFPKQLISDSYTARLLAHQWLLYRYGVYNEFGYVSDASYPVYFAPSDGGVQNRSSASITSCSNKPEFNYTSQCHSQEIDPDTGRPLDPSCDVVPVENSISSSFLYAPLVVSEFKLCDRKTHDFVSPNKQNILCDYQSAEEVIRKHADFDIFKHQLVPKKTSSPIQFKIWQKKSAIESKSYMMYAFPTGYQYYSALLSIIIQVSGRYDSFRHQAKIRFYDNANLLSVQSVENQWQPSKDLSPSGIDTPITGKVNLMSILGQIVPQFETAEAIKKSGICILVVSGKHEVESVTNERDIEVLADRLNAAGIGLRIIVVDQVPGQQVLSLLEKLTSKLITESTVNYAITPSSSSSSALHVANQVFSTVNTIVWDSIQDITEQSHIVLKRETFNPLKTKINFAIDESFKNLPNDRYKILVEAFTTGKSNNLNITMFRSGDGKAIKAEFLDDRSNEYLSYIIYKGSNIKPGYYQLDVGTLSAAESPLVTVTIRVLSDSSHFVSHHKQTPITARCWVRADASTLRKYPLRGYVQLSKGLNGPVYEADVSLIVRRFDSASQYQELPPVPLSDNGHGSPDITARDGVYSGYIDQVLQPNAAYSVSARIYSDKLSLKPGNYGNTVMFKNKPRCCGSDLLVKNDDEVLSGAFDRVVSCGSFYYAEAQTNKNNYAIRDLRLKSLDSENRTITLEWSSPFMPEVDQSKTSKADVKAFHSYTQHTALPADIKENFATLASADTEIVPPLVLRPAAHSAPNMEPYEQIMYDISPYEQLAGASQPANSLQTVTLRILSPEEGYYFVAVAEHANDGRKSKASNVLPIYLKSNVPIENTTALAIDDSKLPEGTRRESLGTGPLSWWHILIICIGSALVLLIIVLIIICLVNKKNRQASSKQSHVDYEKKVTPTMAGDSESKASDSKPSQYYLNQDASSLISNSLNERNVLPNSNVSNHTSCSSVNTVDQNNGYMTPAHLEPIQRHNHAHHQHQHQHPQQQHQLQQQHLAGSPNMSQHSPNSNQSIVKELNVAQLLPNSWDAKELLDHWGRVQEAKQRQESPPVHARMHNTSPSIPSFGGSSSTDQMDGFNGGFGGQYQTAPTMPPPLQSTMSGHYVHDPTHESVEYHQPIMYSPYSNASSIWQHHHQQQQQHQTGPPRSYGHHQAGGAPVHHLATPYQPSGYEENGLPEYSIVRKDFTKVHPNISQV